MIWTENKLAQNPSDFEDNQNTLDVFIKNINIKKYY